MIRLFIKLNILCDIPIHFNINLFESVCLFHNASFMLFLNEISLCYFEVCAVALLSMLIDLNHVTITSKIHRFMLENILRT